ncbi:MAG: methionyl-tRNA formyltransferase [Sphingobacteriaceae bacterium]|nr:methionyl-tRNA formyltransferase [Sphingobacteriaceae bacterium]
MRIVFMGTPEFAVASLEALIQNKLNIVAVVTAPDKPAGRGKLLTESPIKKFALTHNLPLLQPANLKSSDFAQELKAINADLQIVVAFRMLPEIIWNMPRLGTYNLHASLLPAYRGAAPINWSIINGENYSGVTTFKLVHEIDAGNILFQEKIEIADFENSGDLHDKLKITGAQLLVKTIKAISNADENKIELPFIKQDETKISHAPKLNRINCKINWHNSAKSIHNLIRGLSPYPGAYSILMLENKELSEWKILKSNYQLKSHAEKAGTLLIENYKIMVFAKDGIIEIIELQQQGKKRMLSADFLRGFKFQSGYCLQ